MQLNNIGNKINYCNITIIIFSLSPLSIAYYAIIFITALHYFNYSITLFSLQMSTIPLSSPPQHLVKTSESLVLLNDFKLRAIKLFTI